MIDRSEPAESFVCCEVMELAIDDHKAIYPQTIGSLQSDELDTILMYVGGDIKLKAPAIVQYCPFCGKPRRRASEYKGAKK